MLGREIMTFASLRGWLLLGLALAACGPPNDPMLAPSDDAGGDADLAREIDDAHLSTGCTINGDCDDDNPCTIDSCTPKHECVYRDKDCGDNITQCNVGTCDRATGACGSEPGNEGMACNVTTTTKPGHCLSGVCSLDPMCSLVQSSLNCTYLRDHSATLSGAGTIDKYTCGAGFDGPEHAYPLQSLTDRLITVSLSGGSGDLDLLVLDGNLCTTSAACVAKSVTVGSSVESLTFSALANHNYTLVVESHAGSSGTYNITVSCASCVTPRELACNQTVSGDTSRAGAPSNMGSYTCGARDPGPEDSYSFSQTTDTTYNLKLTGLQQDLDLVVVGDYQGTCDPTACRAQSVATGTTNEALSFLGGANTSFYAVVDSKGAGGPYQLEVSCPPSCRNTSNSIYCSTPSDTRRNDDPARSKNTVDGWSCDPGTTGPEVVYSLFSSSATSYTFDLTGLTADLDLIVVEGSYSACDPSAACVASSVHAGTADESVTFQTKANTYYWIGVDGKGGAVSPYVLKMKSPACPGPSCYQSSNRLGCNYLEDRRRNDDATRSKNAIDAWACDPGTTGPEIVYQFKPPVTGSYTVSLDGLSADLDLVVLESTSSMTCDSSAACLQSSTNAMTLDETLTFNADASKYYYIGVDGKAGAVSPYHIRLSSASCPAPVCVNANHSLNCVVANRSGSYQNDQTGSTNDVNGWSCATGESGPEMAHLFTPTGAGPYTVELIGLSADLDLVVLDAGPASSTNVCNPTAACVGSSVATGSTAEKVTFTADPSRRYWLVVDGKAGAISAYTLAITAGCPP